MFFIRKTHKNNNKITKSPASFCCRHCSIEKYLFLSRNDPGHFLFLPPPFPPQITELQNELDWKRPKDHLVPPPCHGQGHFSLDHVTQSPKGIITVHVSMSSWLHKSFLSHLWIACGILGEFWTRLMPVLVFYLRDPWKILFCHQESAVVIVPIYTNKDWEKKCILGSEQGSLLEIPCVSHFSRIQEKVLNIFF